MKTLESGVPSKGMRENPLAGKTVVVVDDSQVQRRKLKELYESMGFKCIGEAANGLDGLTLCEKLKPDLVSLDILMPVMHGVETLGYIREANIVPFVVLVSAVPNLEDVAKLRPKGQVPDAIFSKKDSRETFREVLTNVFLSHEIAFAAQNAQAEKGSETSGEPTQSSKPAS
jgi:CheY-like chemotaxis protein